MPGVSFSFTEPNTDYTRYLDSTGQFSWTNTRNQRGSLSLPLRVAPGDSFAPQCGWTVWVYENFRSIASRACVWIGSISGIDLGFNAGNEGYHTFQLSGISAERFFDGVQTPIVEFNDFSSGAIFSYLAAYAINIGLPIPITLGTVDAGAPVANRRYDGKTSVGAALQQLAIDSGYVQYIDPSDQTINFHARDVRPAPFIVQNDPVTGRGMIRFGTLRFKQSDADFRDKQVLQLDADVVPSTVTVYTGDLSTVSTRTAYTDIISASDPTVAASLGLASNFQIRRALTGAKNLTAAQQLVEARLAAYSTLPSHVIYELADEVTGNENAVLYLGREVTHNISAPAEAGGLVNSSTWIVQSITGRLPEARWENLPEPYGHFRYSLELVNTLDVSTFQDTLNQLSGTTNIPPSNVDKGGPSGLSFHPHSRDILLTDLTVADNIVDAVLVLTPITALTSPPTHEIMQGMRICAVVRTGIVLTSDLTVRINKTTVTSPVTTASWTVTIPSGWPPMTPIVWEITGPFYDLDILSADILASDGQKDKDGVCSIAIEWD